MSLNKTLHYNPDDDIVTFEDDIFHPQFLLIEQQGQLFALDASLIKEVLLVDELTPLPGFPHQQIGTTTIRGQTLYTLPLKLILNACESDDLPTCNSIIIIEERPELNMPRFGLLVERILQLCAFKASNIRSLSETESQHQTKFLGKSHLRNRDVFILNHETLLQKNWLMQSINQLNHPSQGETSSC